MAKQQSVPEDAIAFIQACVRQRKVYWTYHVNMRLAGRFIARQAKLDAVDTYELVEAYPDDKYLPSYLVLGQSAADSFHVVFAADIEGDNVRVVTAYRPDPDKWDGSRRRRPEK